MNRTDIEALRSEVERADELLEARKFAEARDVLLPAAKRAEETGVQSAMLMSALSYALEGAGDAEGAYDWARRAICRDPISQLGTGRLLSALARLRELHERPGTPPEDVRRIYEKLLRAGEATVDSHLVMVLLALEEKNVEEAQRLVDALILLEPSNPEVWNHHALVAEARGATEVAKQSESRAEALAEVPPPWGIATPTAEC